MVFPWSVCTLCREEKSQPQSNCEYYSPSQCGLSRELQEFLQVMCSLLELKSFRTLKELFMPYLKCAWLATDVFLWKKYAHWVLNELQIVPLIIPLSDCEKCIWSNVKSEWKYGSPCIIRSIRSHMGGGFCIPQPSGNFWEKLMCARL